MNIIYIHGLDSDAHSTKGRLLENYCRQYHLDITVLRPDLNKTPDQVVRQILSLIERLNRKEHAVDEPFEPENTVLVGSSLGGYFSTLISNETGIPVLLLNPSTQPHLTLQRFTKDFATKNDIKEQDLGSQIIHSTAGGWDITQADLQWFAAHPLLEVNYSDSVAVLIKEGDELLNSSISADFYRQEGAAVTLQEGGDHRFSDFSEQLPMIIKILQQL